MCYSNEFYKNMKLSFSESSINIGHFFFLLKIKFRILIILIKIWKSINLVFLLTIYELYRLTYFIFLPYDQVKFIPGIWESVNKN